LRIYQKGLQIAEQLALTGNAIPDDLRHWVRVELEYKPDKGLARERAAKLSPAELWGCSPWTRAFAKQALAINAERVKMTERRESSVDRAYRFAAAQYGPTFLLVAARLGGWEIFSEDLRQRISYDQSSSRSVPTGTGAPA
jgi:DNA relaxase NicK